jgi:protocatechuate 3,4-dioxygenase beta subunit
LDKIRRDVTEGKPGLRLDLRVKVVNASTCKALEDVAAEIWHADAGGTYSGFSQEGTAGKTYLRGVQLTNENGVAQFRTVYPGSTDGELAGPEVAAASGRRVTEFMRPRSGPAARGAWGDAES